MSADLLVADGLRVTYRTGALGIVDVSIRANAGAVVAIFGPLGAGKTTTVRAMSGFLKTEGTRVTAGRVLVDGADMTNSEPYKFSRAGVASIPERRKIFPYLSVMENLLAQGRLPSKKHLAKRIEYIFSYFPDLGKRSSAQALQLSGGQQQMLAIGRALVGTPRILIIDELTLGIHIELIPILFAALRGVADDGAAVLVVDENVDAARAVADYCYVLSSGRVHDEGLSRDFDGTDRIETSYVSGSSSNG